ncbi:hypothetical protein OSTOST_03228 [Ostertagia ostertagi]
MKIHDEHAAQHPNSVGTFHQKKNDFIIVGGRPNEYRFTVMLILGLKGPPWKSVQEHGMRITPVLGLRRIINSAYHPFQTIPKPDRWHTRERLSRFTAVCG